MSFFNLKDLLPQSLARNRIKPQVEASNVLEEFQKFIQQVWGEEIAQLVTAKYVKNRILYVQCNSATAAQALSLAKKKIKEELNRVCSDSLLEDIVFWQ